MINKNNRSLISVNETIDALGRFIESTKDKGRDASFVVVRSDTYSPLQILSGKADRIYGSSSVKYKFSDFAYASLFGSHEIAEVTAVKARNDTHQPNVEVLNVMVAADRRMAFLIETRRLIIDKLRAKHG